MFKEMFSVQIKILPQFFKGHENISVDHTDVLFKMNKP